MYGPPVSLTPPDTPPPCSLHGVFDIDTHQQIKLGVGHPIATTPLCHTATYASQSARQATADTQVPTAQHSKINTANLHSKLELPQMIRPGIGTHSSLQDAGHTRTLSASNAG